MRTNSSDIKAAGSSVDQGNRRAGLAMLLVVVALVIAAAVAYGVLSVGHHERTRHLTVYKAKYAAQAGGESVARSLNTVSMNNLRSARYLSMINILDSVDLASQAADRDAAAVREVMTNLLEQEQDRIFWTRSQPHNRGGMTEEHNYIRRLLSLELSSQSMQSRNVERVTSHFRDVEGGVTAGLAELTHYTTPTGKRGELWRAIESLQGISATAMQNLESMAQLNAARAGATAVEGAHTDSVLLMDDPGFAWQAVHFDQFRDAVAVGNELPRSTMHPEDDDLDMWGNIHVESDYSQRRRYRQQIVADAKGNVPLGSAVSASNDRSNTSDEQPPLKGIQDQLISSYRHSTTDTLGTNRMSDWLARIADIKLSYLWNETKSDKLQNVHLPTWTTDVKQVFSLADKDSKAIDTVAILRVQVRSIHPMGHPDFFKQGTWTIARHRGEARIALMYLDGWSQETDPRNWEKLKGVSKVTDRVWMDQWQYEVYRDPSLDIEIQYDEKRKRQPQTVYRVDSYVLIGVCTGEPVQVRNPHNFEDRSTLPGPIVLTSPTGIDNAVQVGSITRHIEKSWVWANPLKRGEPNVFAISSATVACPQAASLWTRTWEATPDAEVDVEHWRALAKKRAEDIAAYEPAVGENFSEQLLDQLSTGMVTSEEIAQ